MLLVDSAITKNGARHLKLYFSSVQELWHYYRKLDNKSFQNQKLKLFENFVTNSRHWLEPSMAGLARGFVTNLNAAKNLNFIKHSKTKSFW